MPLTEEILSATDSLCPECFNKVPAFYVKRGETVYLVKTCEYHGCFETVFWRGDPSFETWVRPKTAAEILHPFTDVDKGCPFDCGLCAAHRQHTCTALIEVTQRCNMGCVYCFADSRAVSHEDPGLGVIRYWFQCLLDAGGPYNVQLSGGEPTMRDDLAEIIGLGKSMGFDFIQLNTNGIRLAHDLRYLNELKEAGLSSVFLQFDSSEDKADEILRGRSTVKEKITAIERCAELDIGVVLVPTVVPDVNVNQIGNILRLAISYSPVVRGVHFQPVSYFGRHPVVRGGSPARITLPEVMQAVAAQTNGLVSLESFKPPGCENALCSFHGNYVVMPGGKLLPLTSFKGSGCCPTVEDGAQGAENSRNLVARNWKTAVESAPGATEAERYSLGGWDDLLVRAQTHRFSISGMAFQDIWNLDVERLKDCCIHIVSPEGCLVPFCAYNVTTRTGQHLYRYVPVRSEV